MCLLPAYRSCEWGDEPVFFLLLEIVKNFAKILNLVSALNTDSLVVKSNNSKKISKALVNIFILANSLLADRPPFN